MEQKSPETAKDLAVTAKALTTMEVLVFFSFKMKGPKRSVSKVPVNYQSNCRWIESFGGGNLKAPIKFFFSFS